MLRMNLRYMHGVTWNRMEENDMDINIDIQELLQALSDKMKADGCRGCKYQPEPE